MDKPDTGGREDAVRLASLHKVYGEGGNSVVALGGVTIGFRQGSFTAIMGPSGSGKTTLLQAAAGLERPTSGSVVVGGKNRVDAAALCDLQPHLASKVGELDAIELERVRYAGKEPGLVVTVHRSSCRCRWPACA